MAVVGVIGRKGGCGKTTLAVERSLIQERVRAGLERARARGKRLGRPKVTAKVERAVVAARAEGRGSGAWLNSASGLAPSNASRQSAKAPRREIAGR